MQFAKSTSWGLTTRLIGAVVMTHGDDDGLRLPPVIAPSQVVIIPVNPKGDDKINQACLDVKGQLEAMMFADEKLRVKIDDRDMRGGDKSWDWIKKGIPLRIEIGPRDLENDSVMLKRRDQSPKDRTSIKMNDLKEIPEILQAIQDTLFEEAKSYQADQTTSVKTKDELLAHFEEGKSGFVHIPYAGGVVEAQPLSEHQISIRCLLPSQQAVCGFTGQKTTMVAVIAKAY